EETAVAEALLTKEELWKLGRVCVSISVSYSESELQILVILISFSQVLIYNILFKLIDVIIETRVVKREWKN
ncbi:hypothetical protein MUP01_08920, partial [Candidatus Bathyarchaeota archaeon]|nr:hypothetical protein [Candidatus Bathyarchaeota archaeon]